MRAIAAVAMLATLLTPLVTLAGTTGSLTGTITDSNVPRAPVAGATIVIESSSQREQTTSDAFGRFSVVSLYPGNFTVVVSRSGYASARYEDVAVSADVWAQLPVTPRRHLITGISDSHYPSLVRERVTSDVYTVTPAIPFYSFGGNDMYALHFIPGLTFGSGPALPR
jgi:Carboxypeptidase regulatory-like domain